MLHCGFVDSAWHGCWKCIWVVDATIWLCWALWHSRLDLERSSYWNVTWNLGLIWNKALHWEELFIESSLSDLLSLTQTSLALGRKFVEIDGIILLSLILNVLTLRANQFNMTWFCFLNLAPFGFPHLASEIFGWSSKWPFWLDIVCWLAVILGPDIKPKNLFKN